MSASQRTLRRRRVRSQGRVPVAPPPRAARVPPSLARRTIPLGLLVAIVVSGGAHALLLHWAPSRPIAPVDQHIVIRSTRPPPDKPPPPPPPPIAEPEPPPPPPPPPPIAEPPPPAPPPETQHRPRRPPPGPVPEVFGVDAAGTASHGLAIPVGNSLMLEPEESQDVAVVEPIAASAPPPPPPPPPPPEPPPPPTPQGRRGPYAVDEVTEPPQFVRRVAPRYTDSALDAEVEGVVLVRVVIRANGLIRSAYVIQGLGFGLDEEALSAVQSSTFRPATLQGCRVPCVLDIPYRFTLDD